MTGVESSARESPSHDLVAPVEWAIRYVINAAVAVTENVGVFDGVETQSWATAASVKLELRRVILEGL